MKKTTITLSFDEEKLFALKKYMGQKKVTLETELEKQLENLYAKNVPIAVREFIVMKSADEIQAIPKPKKVKQGVPSSVVGVAYPEVKHNE